jgi:hypothetical protein
MIMLFKDFAVQFEFCAAPERKERLMVVHLLRMYALSCEEHLRPDFEHDKEGLACLVDLTPVIYITLECLSEEEGSDGFTDVYCIRLIDDYEKIVSWSPDLQDTMETCRDIVEKKYGQKPEKGTI